MFDIKNVFKPNFERYEGVRPINIYLLRLFYFLMAAFVATETWTTIVTHQGSWDHIKAVAFCVWAAYPTLAIFGIFHPLRWLPIIIFMIFYKTIWLFIVAYPLWRANALKGSPAEEMTYVFMMVPLAMIAVPWKYAFQHYVLGVKNRPVTKNGGYD
jgi:hypothetical protein